MRLGVKGVDFGSYQTCDVPITLLRCSVLYLSPFVVRTVSLSELFTLKGKKRTTEGPFHVFRSNSWGTPKRPVDWPLNPTSRPSPTTLHLVQLKKKGHWDVKPLCEG